MQSRHRFHWFIALILSFCWFALAYPGEPAQAAAVDEMAFVPRQALSALKFTKRPTVEPLQTLWENTVTSQLAVWGWPWSEVSSWVEERGVMARLPCPTEQCPAPRQVWIFHLKRPEASEAFLAQYWQSHPVQSQTYGEIPLQVGESLATARLGELLFVASDGEALMASLGSATTSDANLAGLGFYRQALEQLNPQDSLIFYGNLQPLTPPEQFTAAYDRLLLGVYSHNNEIHLETALHSTQDTELAAVPLVLGDLRNVGDRPSGVLAGSQLAATYDQALAALSSFTVGTTAQGTAIARQLLTDLTADVPVNLEQVIFPLASGRYTLALWRQASGQWQWWWQSTQGSETPKLLATLDDLAKAAGYDVNRLVLNQAPVTAWVRLALAPETTAGLASEVAAVYQQNKETLTLASALSYLAPSPQRSSWLTEEVTRQRRPILGLAYGNWGDLYPYLAQRLPLLTYLNGLSAGWLEGLQSVTWVNYGGRDRLQTSELILRSKGR